MPALQSQMSRYERYEEWAMALAIGVVLAVGLLRVVEILVTT